MVLSLLLCLIAAISSFIAAEDYGNVVIILARGRSGSGFLCRVAANIVGQPLHSFTTELLGGNPTHMQLLQDPVATIDHYLHERRSKQQSTSSYIGFKWKPYVMDQRYNHAVNHCVHHGFKFVFMTRNALDEFISRQKHKDGSLPPHCRPGDEKCYAQLSQKQFIDPAEAMDFIRMRTAEDEILSKKLRSLGAHYVQLSYENLTYGSDTERLKVLQPVADLLLPATEHQHRRIVTMRDFQTDTEPTSASKQSDKVSNYEILSQELRANGFGYILRG